MRAAASTISSLTGRSWLCAGFSVSSLLHRPMDKEIYSKGFTSGIAVRFPLPRASRAHPTNLCVTPPHQHSSLQGHFFPNYLEPALLHFLSILSESTEESNQPPDGAHDAQTSPHLGCPATQGGIPAVPVAVVLEGCCLSLTEGKLRLHVTLHFLEQKEYSKGSSKHSKEQNTYLVTSLSNCVYSIKKLQDTERCH